MSAERLSYRYAKSILDLAKEQNAVDAVYTDFQSFKQNLSESSELASFLKSPIINPSKKAKALEALYKGKMNDLTYSFLDLVVKKRREVYLPEIANAFIGLYNDEKGIISAKVTTAVVISEQLIEKIKNMVKANTGAKIVELSTKVDASLIGGFILQYGDNLYDSSIAHKLELLQKENFTKNKYLKEY